MSVGMVEVDEDPGIPARYGVRGLPIVATKVGGLTRRRLHDWVYDHVFSRPWTKRKALRTPSERVEARSTPSDADQPSSCTASTRHRLGVIAQTLEHWEAAERCYAEALRIAVELDEHMLCAQSCHQLSEIRQAEGRLDEAVGWSILAFAVLDMRPEKRNRADFSNLADLADRVSVEACQAEWLAVTGGHLPIGLRQSVQRLLTRGRWSA